LGTALRNVGQLRRADARTDEAKTDPVTGRPRLGPGCQCVYGEVLVEKESHEARPDLVAGESGGVLEGAGEVLAGNLRIGGENLFRSLTGG
jgi:hypothetical protein